MATNTVMIITKFATVLLGLLTVASTASGSNLSIDCHPETGATQQRCESRGCSWIPKSAPGAPYCEFSNSDDPSTMAGYDASGEASLRSIVDDTNQANAAETYVAKLTRRSTPTLFGGDYEKATVKIEQVTDDIVKLTIADQQDAAHRAKFPEWKLNLQQNYGGRPRSRNDESPLSIVVEKSPFGFAVVRRSTGVPLIDSRQIPGFTFAEQYVQLSTRVPTQYVYGLGETTHDQLKHDFNYKKWGFFARDNGPGQSNINLYGVHPFYLCLDDQNGNAHGVFFLNTHALNVALQPDPSNPQGGIISWRAIGGAVELFVFAGPTPDDVIRQYTSLVGRPQLPPYWALGFQLSRYGYKNLTFLESIFQRNRQASIPQDTQVVDIDYMNQYLDFTYDPVAFANFSGFIQSLHEQYKMKLVLIVDPGIASRPSITYDPLTAGLRSNVFIRDNRTGQPLEGKVWPGQTYFPDFTHPNTSAWWTTSIKDFYQKQGIQFDGLWIDMNEPSNAFVDGSMSGCAKNALTQPPYNPLIYGNIWEKTICLDADQYAGKHYEYHNLYGYGEAQATYEALQSLFPNKRPFVLSRSTFAGSGKYTNHWLGDNRSTWTQLKQSIIGMLEFNLFGIPMVGADICGFGGEATEELCVRWQQTGSFYPFSRNHNDLDSKREQDPGAWSSQGTATIRQALNMRYGLLPYLYTLLQRAHTDGTPVARPMFFDYANDTNTRTIDDQFMWGSGLMVAPVTDPGVQSRTVYFPRGRWFDVMNRTEVPRSDVGRASTIAMPLDAIGVYIRGGAVVPYQVPAVTTAVARNNDLGLLVGLDERAAACGGLYWDHGDSLDGPSSYVQFEAYSTANQGGGIRIRLTKNDSPIGPSLNSATIYGVQSKPSVVNSDGNPIPSSSIVYSEQTKSLTLNQLGMKLDRDHEITWQF